MDIGALKGTHKLDSTLTFNAFRDGSHERRSQEHLKPSHPNVSPSNTTSLFASVTASDDDVD